MCTQVNEGDTSGNNVGPMVPDRYFTEGNEGNEGDPQVTGAIETAARL